jgi:hypothetical protein
MPIWAVRGDHVDPARKRWWMEQRKVERLELARWVCGVVEEDAVTWLVDCGCGWGRRC